MSHHRSARGGKVFHSGRSHASTRFDASAVKEFLLTCGISPKFLPPTDYVFIEIIRFYENCNLCSEELLFLRDKVAELKIADNNKVIKEYLNMIWNGICSVYVNTKDEEKKQMKIDINSKSYYSGNPIPTTESDITQDMNSTTDDIAMKNIDESKYIPPNTENDTDCSFNNNPQKLAKKRKKKKKQNTVKTVENNSAFKSDNSFSSSNHQNTTDVSSILTSTKPTEEFDKDPSCKPETTTQANFIKVLIRGLPVDLEKDYIIAELNKTNINVYKIVQFKRRVGEAYRLLPLFLIILTATENHQRVYKINTIKQFPVKIEKFRGGRGPTQCFNCQNFGHTQRQCNNTSKCVKCAGNHRSHECRKDISESLTCCNCLKNHTANYTGCEARPCRKSRSKRTTSMTKLTHRLVTIIQELKELLKNAEVLRLLRGIMGE